jgi:HSP20 family protein
MLIDKWTPYHDLSNLQHEMNRRFGVRPIARRKAHGSHGDGKASSWRPAADVWEDENKVGLRVELAGLEKDDIDVNIEDGVLTVSGEKRLVEQDGSRSFRRVEAAYGSFTRQFVLPDNLDPSTIEAAYKNGVLDLSIARREESLPKKVDVTIQ